MSALLMLLVSIPLTIFSGWCLSYMWLWFVVPLGVPAIGIAHAIGLNLVASLFTMRANAATDPDMKGWLLILATPLAIAFITLFGLVVSYFM